MEAGNALVVQYLRLHTFTAQGLGSIPGWGTKIPNKNKINQSLDFPGGPVVKTPRFHCRGHGFDPWLEN